MATGVVTMGRSRMSFMVLAAKVPVEENRDDHAEDRFHR